MTVRADDLSIRTEIDHPVRVGSYTLALTEKGVSMLKEQHPGEFAAIWDYPSSDYPVVAGATALFKTIGLSSDTLMAADVSNPEHASFTQIRTWPAIGGIAAVEEGGIVHVAVAAVEQDHERIFYLCRKSGLWSEPRLISPTGLTVPRIMPAISVDGSRITIAYSGFDGEDYEIFVVHGNGSNFEVEKRVTDNHRTADILPSFSADNHTLTWIRNDGAGRYNVESPIAEDGSISDVPAGLLTTARTTGISPNMFCGFGDSITEGDSENGYSRSTNIGYYPTLINLLSNGYGATNVQNRGLGGEGTVDGLVRLPDVLQELSPGYMLIMEGTNDVTKYMSITEAGIRDNLVAMTEICRRAGTTPILGTIIPRGPKDPWDPENARTMRTNNLIRKAFIDGRIDYAEMFDAFYADPNYRDDLMIDHVHPNSKGFELMGQVWYAAVAGLSPQSPSALKATQFQKKKAVNLSWTPSPESDVAGYLLQYGTVPNKYTINKDLGKRIKTLLSGLEFDTTYYFRIRSYDNKKNLSGVSPEASVTIVKGQ